MKTFIAIAVLVILGALAVYFAKGCNSHAGKTEAEKRNDTLKFYLHTDSLQYAARYKSFESIRMGLTAALDSNRQALDFIRKQFTAQGKQILATNKNLHAALIVHDTPEVYKNAYYISFQIDSIAQVKWNVDRELDRQIVLNEQLHTADSTALSDCRRTLKQTQQTSSLMGQNYEIMLASSQQEVKKANRKNKLWGIGGGVLGAAIRSIFK